MSKIRSNNVDYIVIKKFKNILLFIILLTFASPLWASEDININANLSAIESLEQQLDDAKGKVVYVDFWASWCIPCRKSFPWMNNLTAQYQTQGLVILSINLDHSRILADEFLMQIPANFPVIYDPKGTIAKKYQLKGMPSSFIINRGGQIVSAHVGFNQKKKLAYEQEINTLLLQ